MKEMNLKVAEEFLKNNPNFVLYLENKNDCVFSKVITVSGDTDFENLESAYIIKAKDDFISFVDADDKQLEMYRLVK